MEISGEGGGAYIHQNEKLWCSRASNTGDDKLPIGMHWPAKPSLRKLTGMCQKMLCNTSGTKQPPGPGVCSSKQRTQLLLVAGTGDCVSWLAVLEADATGPAVRMSLSLPVPQSTFPSLSLFLLLSCQLVSLSLARPSSLTASLYRSLCYLFPSLSFSVSPSRSLSLSPSRTCCLPLSLYLPLSFSMSLSVPVSPSPHSGKAGGLPASPSIYIALASELVRRMRVTSLLVDPAMQV